MSIDYRALCEELIDALESNHQTWRIPVSPLIARARAALARYGHHPAPVPEASGVYYEFVVSDADSCTQAGGIAPTYAQALSEGQHYLDQYQQDGPHTLELRRVEVLHPDALPEQRYPAPVPVSERLPEARDCLGRPTEASDAGWCWTYSDASERWSFQAVVFPRSHPNPPLVTLKPSVTHWLPHYALPLPAGEVQP